MGRSRFRGWVRLCRFQRAASLRAEEEVFLGGETSGKEARAVEVPLGPVQLSADEAWP